MTEPHLYKHILDKLKHLAIDVEFEIQRRKPQEVEWKHYDWCKSWEIGGETVRWLRENKKQWKYRLIRITTTTELKVLDNDNSLL